LAVQFIEFKPVRKFGYRKMHKKPNRSSPVDNILHHTPLKTIYPSNIIFPSTVLVLFISFVRTVGYVSPAPFVLIIVLQQYQSKSSKYELSRYLYNFLHYTLTSGPLNPHIVS